MAAVLGLLAAAGRAEAGLRITYNEVGPDVVSTAIGSIDLTGLVVFATGSGPISTNPSRADAELGPINNASVVLYSGLTGPSSFGSGGVTVPTSGTGILVGVRGSARDIFVESSYVSGSPISASSSYANMSFATFGLTPGTYLYNIGNNDITIQIGPAIAVPEPSGFVHAGISIAIGGAIWLRRRRRA